VLGTDEARIAKSILFLADDQPLLVVLCGNMTVDPQKLLAQLNSRANQEAGTWGREPAIRTPVSTLILASRRQAEDMTGFRVGTIGPLALRQPITTVIDTQLAVGVTTRMGPRGKQQNPSGPRGKQRNPSGPRGKQRNPSGPRPNARVRVQKQSEGRHRKAAAKSADCVKMCPHCRSDGACAAV